MKYLGVEGKGRSIPEKYFCGLFFFENNRSVVACVLCWQSVSTKFFFYGMAVRYRIVVFQVCVYNEKFREYDIKC